jgi:hypothetical protein
MGTCGDLSGNHFTGMPTTRTCGLLNAAPLLAICPVSAALNFWIARHPGARRKPLCLILEQIPREAEKHSC